MIIGEPLWDENIVITQVCLKYFDNPVLDAVRWLLHWIIFSTILIKNELNIIFSISAFIASEFE